jgi:hypothetical protein
VISFSKENSVEQKCERRVARMKKCTFCYQAEKAALIFWDNGILTVRAIIFWLLIACLGVLFTSCQERLSGKALDSRSI